MDDRPCAYFANSDFSPGPFPPFKLSNTLAGIRAFNLKAFIKNRKLLKNNRKLLKNRNTFQISDRLKIPQYQSRGSLASFLPRKC